jgi:deoxycytidylate deaminase
LAQCYCVKKAFTSSNSSRQSVGKKPVKSVHAEIGALIEHHRDNNIYYLNHIIYKDKTKKKKKLHNAILYVVRFSTRPTNDAVGHACGLAKPCTNCEKYLILHGVGTVKYSENVNGTNVLHTMKLVG